MGCPVYDRETGRGDPVGTTVGDPDLFVGDPPVPGGLVSPAEGPPFGYGPSSRCTFFGH